MFIRISHIYGHFNAESNVWKVHQSEIRARGQLKEDVSNVHGNTALLTYFHSKLWAEALLLHILRRVSEGWKVMKVGFHVYLMPWFAEPCLNVNGNEDWHVENRLRHSSPPQVQQAEQKRSPISQLLPLHLSLQADSITSMTVFSKRCVCMYISLYCSIKGFLMATLGLESSTHFTVLKKTHAEAVTLCSLALLW